MAIVTLEEAKQQLNISASDSQYDAEIQAYCDGISQVIEDYKHEVIEAREIREDIEDIEGVRFRFGGRRFRVWSVPVISITSVTSVLSGTTWDPAALRLDGTSGLVRVLSGPPVCGLVEVVYQAGYTTVPERYKRGALVTLQHTWETRRGVGSKRAGVVGPEENYDPRYSYSIPRKALEWLGAPRPVVG